MKDICKELYITIILGFTVFMGFILRWQMPIAWEYVILIYMISLFIVVRRKKHSSRLFYYIGITFFCILIIFEILGENELSKLAGIFLFYGLYKLSEQPV